MKFFFNLILGFGLSTAQAAFIPDNSVASRHLYTSSIDNKGVVNCSVSTSVASSALTIALKDAAGNTPAAGSPCKISFRNATSATGTPSVVSTTGAVSVVVSNGSALGCTATAACTVYVYAINNGGTVALGVIGKNILDEGSVQTSTAEGGAGAADTGSVLYSTSALSSKAVRLLARLTITPAASHAWTANSTEISNFPVAMGYVNSNKATGERIERATIAITGASACSITSQSGTWITSVSASGTNCTLNFETGIFSATPTCVMVEDSSTVAALSPRWLSGPSSAAIVIQCLTSGAAASTCNMSIICMGPK